MRYLFSMLIVLFSMTLGNAQTSEKQFKSKVFGQWRTYYSGTLNQGVLQDFQALATGGKLGIDVTYGSFVLKVIGYSSINIGIQDLSVTDPITNRLSRYELGLFDVNDPSKRWIGILGEANLGFVSAGHKFQVGRIKLKSPLMNPQDGRMIPTLFQGTWYQFKDKKKLTVQTGVINAIATRSTDRFESLRNTYGLYPSGRNPDGSTSNYRGNVDSDFIWVTNLRKGFGTQVNLDLWNYYVDNVFNTVYSNLTWSIKDSPFEVAAEAVFQRRLADGGNADPSLAYFQSQSAYNFGGQLKYTLDDRQVSIAYNHVPRGGRFLFPREWGREGLFTFQKRERTDGSANNQALLLSYESTFSVKQFSVKGIYSLGHQWKASVTSPKENKYALPSYQHLNLDWFFSHSAIPSLTPEILVTYKRGIGDFPDNPNFILNKVDLVMLNVIFNYNF